MTQVIYTCQQSIVSLSDIAGKIGLKLRSNILEVNKSIQVFRDLEAARNSLFIATKNKSNSVHLSGE
jgi:hypothetical protein